MNDKFPGHPYGERVRASEVFGSTVRTGGPGYLMAPGWLSNPAFAEADQEVAHDEVGLHPEVLDDRQAEEQHSDEVRVRATGVKLFDRWLFRLLRITVHRRRIR
jgi:hypothetical protein